MFEISSLVDSSFKMKQIIVFLLFISLFVTNGKRLPSFIKKCKRNVPELDECMKNSLLDFRERLKKDIVELRFRSLDPYVLPQASGQTPWMNATFTNIKLYGSNNYDVDYFKIDLQENVIWLNLTAPYLYAKAHYAIDGKLLQFVFNDEGDGEIKHNNTKSQMKMYGSRMMKHDKEYLNLKNIDFKLTNYSITYLYLGKLFQDKPGLKEIVNAIIADNLDEFAVHVLPLVEKTVSSICLSMFKEVFDTFSLDELFD